MASAETPNMRQQLMQSLDTAMVKLNQIWERIGIGKVAKEERETTVLHHLQGLLDEMVEEELTLEKQIEERVSDSLKELEVLSKELEIPEHRPKANNGTLQLEKDLQAKVASLRTEKKSRLKVLKSLKQDDQQLCDSLCMAPYYIPTGSTPTQKQLDALREHVNDLTKEKEKRQSAFIKKKKEIADLMIELERSPESSFEKEVISEDEGDFVLSTTNMSALDALLAELLASRAQLEQLVSNLWERLKTLWERLDVPQHEQELFEQGKTGFKSSTVKAIEAEIEDCEAKKLANIQRFVDGTRRDIETWWDKCFYSAEQRSRFKMFTHDNYTEDLLNEHEAELNSLKEYYEANKQILELVEKRETLFHKMIEFEKKAHDPNRFFTDRGGKLLLEEKERKSLMKQLPKVEHSVKEDILAWEKENNRTFLVNGMSFIRYIEKTWHDFEEEKQREKQERQKAKTKLMNEELMYGSKPTTPAKRRMQPNNTPSKTPKYRKIEYSEDSVQVNLHVNVKVNDSRAPSCTSRLMQSTVCNSPFNKKTPLSTTRVPQASKIMSASNKTAPGSRARRRSNRLARKILGERNEGTNESVFSQTTVSNGSNANSGAGGNISLASTGSYQDFAVGLNPSARPFCRSSILPPSSPRPMTHTDQLNRL